MYNKGQGVAAIDKMIEAGPSNFYKVKKTMSGTTED
jgi:hypothetical protein